MLLNMAYLMYTWLFQHFGHIGPFGPFGHMGYFGPFAGRISPLLLFFGILFLLAILRRGNGGNPHHGSYYNPQNQNRPPAQGPAGDTPRNPQGQGGYNPYAGPTNSQYSPRGDYGEYMGYAYPANAGEQGAQTIRVDQMGNNADQNAGTNTIRMDSTPESAATGMGAGSGQPTTPLRGQPVIPANEYDPNKARVEQSGEETDNSMGA